MAKNEEDSNKLNGTPEGPVSGFEPNTTSPGSTDVSTSTGAGGGGTFVNDFGMTVAVPTSPVFPGVPNSDLIQQGRVRTLIRVAVPELVQTLAVARVLELIRVAVPELVQTLAVARVLELIRVAVPELVQGLQVRGKRPS
jgi:hypothetical protein